MKDLLRRILTEPVPDDVWQLHPHLLAAGESGQPALAVAEKFYCYLSTVRSKLTSKRFSSFAASLAAGSMGVIALEDVVESMGSRDHQGTLFNLMAGGLAATLEVAATWQHVKAWETEFTSVHEECVWFLYEVLWTFSAEHQPEMPLSQRHALIDHLLGAVRSPEVNSTIRMALIIRLFQFLLVIRAAPLLLEAE